MNSPLAEGFAHHMAQWAQALGCHARDLPLLQRAAQAVSEATTEGHACLWLDELLQPGTDNEQLRQGLLATGVVATPHHPGNAPLVLDEEGRLYLHRYFDFERRLAQRLLRAAQADRLTLICGGPGSGKTTAVLDWMADLLSRQAQARMALAAPTGKAAARMAQAISLRSKGLPATVQAVLPTQATTVHRLLGVRGADRSFLHHAGKPLPIDALVIDEASMLDLALAYRLMDAVPEHAHIVLLGDPDQLAAVEAGAVFGELCGNGQQGAAAGAHPLAHSVRRFTHSHRFPADSDMGRLATSIRLGRADEALADLVALAPLEGRTIRWFSGGGAGLDAAEQQAICGGFEAYLSAVLADPQATSEVALAFDRFRVLCAVHEGPRGTRAVNALVQQHAQHVLAQHPACTDIPKGWTVGQPVMVLRNDPAQKLFNGDVGIALPDQQGRLMVHFADGVGGARSISPARLPEHHIAYAMTVHKAQGSEFDEVLMVLPSQPSKVLTRELLYTAVTRSRQHVTLCGSSAMLRAAIASPTRRHAGLTARLHDALAAGPMQHLEPLSGQAVG